MYTRGLGNAGGGAGSGTSPDRSAAIEGFRQQIAALQIKQSCKDRAMAILDRVAAGGADLTPSEITWIGGLSSNPECQGSDTAGLQIAGFDIPWWALAGVAVGGYYMMKKK